MGFVIEKQLLRIVFSFVFLFFISANVVNEPNAQAQANQLTGEVASSSSPMATKTIEQCLSPRVDAGSGVQKIALMIAIDEYPQSPEWVLDGPVNDLFAMKSILGEYGYDAENICVLTNQDATFPNVASAFRHHLIDRLDSDDEVFVFFAGHGTEVPSLNSDEFTGRDQALVLYDSYTRRDDGAVQPFLIDDEFGGMLQAVREKTKNITVVIDSCHSGSATRNRPGHARSGARLAPRLSAAESEVRFFPGQTILDQFNISPISEGESSWASVAPEGTTVLAAARDGTLAYETDGNGEFTAALVDIIAAGKGAPVSLQALERRLRSKFSGKEQTPVVHGDPNQFFLSSEKRAAVFSLSVAEPVRRGRTKLIGLRLATTDIGAEFSIYGNSAVASDFNDPSKAKASAVARFIEGPSVIVDVSPHDGAESVEPGDLAIQVAPSDRARRFEVNISELSAEEAAILGSSLASSGADGALVSLEQMVGTYSIIRGGVGFQIIGPDFRVRNSEALLEHLIPHLTNHARQWSLKQLGGEGGLKYRDNATLAVRLVAPGREHLPNYSFCDPSYARAQTKLLETWSFIGASSVPFCSFYAVEVSAEIPPSDTTTEVDIGAFVFSHDGSILALGRGQQIILSSSNPKHVFLGEDVLQAFVKPEGFDPNAPLRLEEELVVFGVDADSSIPWELFGTETNSSQRRERSAGKTVSNPLFQQLSNYVAGGSRTGRPAQARAKGATWTVTRETFSIAVNEDGFAYANVGNGNSREYTISKFDIRPHLPDDSTSALYKVLTAADALAKASKTDEQSEQGDGFAYTQHGWCEGSDASNLAKGIDCSRSIWYAFTRAGLPYTLSTPSNRDDRACYPYGHPNSDYLVTADMVGAGSRMSIFFEDCMTERPFKTGDVLVYRDESRGVGHTVMVIDPVERVAWGSHGWDGNPLIGQTADTGVEYQKILRKPDWGAWDRTTMSLEACWRHRQFEHSEGYNLSWLKSVMCTQSELGFCEMGNE